MLKELLKDGPKPANEVRRYALDEEVRLRTLRRAKEQLGVSSIHDEDEARWVWSLPDTTTRHVPEAELGAR